jgi:hypothetical protein
MRQFPERRILEAFTVEDISTIVKDDYALILVQYIHLYNNNFPVGDILY